MKMFRKDEGFTLVELMVVVLIIGILVAIAVPVFLNASANAQLKSCQASQRTIEGSVQTYNANQGNGAQFPAAATLINGSDALTSGANQTIKSAPKCPTGAAGTYYCVTAGFVTGDQAASTSVGNAAMVHAHY